MPGPMQLAFGCRPSFFQALRVEGASPVVCVVEERGELLGVGAVSFRQVFLNGRSATLRYLSALRALPQIRGSTALARAFARMRVELAGRPGDVTLTAILADNATALRVLPGARAGMPVYQHFCDCVTRVVAVSARGPASRCPPSPGCQIGPAADAAELGGFFARHGPAQNFFPVCVAEDLDGREASAFPGLRAEDFVVARDGSTLLGVMGCWDVSRFRQAVVTGYGGALRWARPWLNLAARCAGRPLLPRPGAALGLVYGTLTRVVDPDPRVFHSLLDGALALTRRRGGGPFVLALAADDPLAGCFKAWPHHAIASRIFQVEFGSPATAAAAPDGRTAHFEGAML